VNARRLIAALLLLVSGPGSPVWGAIGFFSHGSTAISASATIAPIIFDIQADPLPTQAFFGKDVVIPVQVISHSGPIATRTVSVSMVYQLIDPSGAALGAPVSAPVSLVSPSAVHAQALSAAASGPTSLSGTVVIPASDLLAIQHGGGLQYVFQVQQGGSHTLLTQSGMKQMSGNLRFLFPFTTMITDQVCQTMGPEGGRLDAPDLFEHDGKTSVTLPPGAVSSMGNLCIKQVDPANFPSGPGHAQPAAVYSITFDGGPLSQTAQINLSYPSDSLGNVSGLHVGGNDLSLFWLGPEDVPSSDQSWHVLSRASVDTTLHTVSGVSSHFSTFALFASSSDNAAAALRPSQRIITIHGDPKNAKASFGSGIDEVKIYDVRGRRVKTLTGMTLEWDGTDDRGSVVESGVYIYQYTSQGERVSGVIAVAK
jgi:hypothetical protein